MKLINNQVNNSLNGKKLKSKYDITFGIPCYNAEENIIKLLECFNNSNSNSNISYEIIIIDDGSTDKTYEKCKSFIINNSNININLFKRKNKGVSYTRNEIIQKSQGKYITFIDADDRIIFDKYVKIIKDIKNSNYDYVICNNNINSYKISELISKEILNSPCSKIYERKLLVNNSINFMNSIDLGEDLIFNLKYASIANNPTIIHESPYIVIPTKNSLTRKERQGKEKTLDKVYLECTEINKNYLGNNKKIEKSLDYIKIKNLYSCLKTYTKDDYKAYYSILKKMAKRKHLMMNSFYETAIYNSWFLTPLIIKKKLIGNRNEKRNNNR